MARSIARLAALAIALSACTGAAPASSMVVLQEDGNNLLYGRFITEERKAAFIANGDGSGEHRVLLDVDGDIRALTWIPDGYRMSFVVRDAQYPDGAIWTADQAGEGAGVFYDGRADGCDSVFHPSWSPDFSQMALVCYGARGSSLAVLQVATKHLRPLATYAWPEFLDNPARWSRDGHTLAYDVLKWDPTDEFIVGSRIATIPADGSAQPTYLNDFDSFAVRPAWGPDDITLIYNTYDLSAMHGDWTSDLFTMSTDGSGVQTFLTAAEVDVDRLAQPLWDPDVDRSRVWVTALMTAGLRIGWVDPAAKELNLLPIEGSAADVRP
jgi:hypothetical protein